MIHLLRNKIFRWLIRGIRWNSHAQSRARRFVLFSVGSISFLFSYIFEGRAVWKFASRTVAVTQYTTGSWEEYLVNRAVIIWSFVTLCVCVCVFSTSVSGRVDRSERIERIEYPVRVFLKLRSSNLSRFFGSTRWIEPASWTRRSEAAEAAGV